MKKIAGIIGFVLLSAQANAQALNEVKWNVLNTIVQLSCEVGYEHFIDINQSVGADLLINDRFSYFGENKKESKYKKFNTNSIALNYNFYFGDASGEHAAGIFVQPFVKYRFGDYEYRNEDTGLINKVDMNSIILGVGGGYKYVKNDAFTITPFANIARNFSNEVSSEFMGIELNAGINLGYRF